MLAKSFNLAIEERSYGLGRLIISAVLRRDYPVIQGVVLLIAVSYTVINLPGAAIMACILGLNLFGDGPAISWTPSSEESKAPRERTSPIRK